MWASGAYNTTRTTLFTVFCGAIVIVFYVLLNLSVEHPDQNQPHIRSESVSSHRCHILTDPHRRSFLSDLSELDLSDCNLPSIPATIRLATNLVKLDVSHNPLQVLPSELAQCTKLSILFASNTRFISLPPVLGNLTSLTRLGIKSSRLAGPIRGDALPPNLVHLILTNNQITEFDRDAYSKLASVRKFMLAHNSISGLSSDISQLTNLELMRVSHNELSSVPLGLFESCPKLAWLSLSGNPRLDLPILERTVPVVHRSEIEILENVDLGEGSSGTVRAGLWKGRSVAIKLIKDVTSDGMAVDELAVYGAVGEEGMKHNLVGCVGVLEAGDGRPGVIMERLPSGLRDLALPPTIVEVTEDRWGNETFTPRFVSRALRDVAEALAYLHGTLRIAHGDVYAHNIKVSTTGEAYLLDFGASYPYGGKTYAKGAEQLEVRSFGILMGELLDRLDESRGSKELEDRLRPLIKSCVGTVTQRPLFKEIVEGLR